MIQALLQLPKGHGRIKRRATAHLVLLAPKALVPDGAAPGAELGGTGRTEDGAIATRLSLQHKRSGTAGVGAVEAQLVRYAGLCLHLQSTQCCLLSAGPASLAQIVRILAENR